MNSVFARAAAGVGYAITIAFGVWHFFVPRAWDWYRYIDEQATELVAAVRAVNVFFSLALVLFGLTGLIFLFRKPDELFSMRVHLGAMVLLWSVRVVMQILYPQGTINPLIRYSMLSAFILEMLLFTAGFAGTWR